MNRECCLFDELFQFVLKRAEASPNPTFLENELTSISRPSFERLKKEKFLKYVQYDPEQEPYYPPGDDGDGRLVRKIDGKYLAFPAEGSPLTLTLEDLNRWSFDVNPLLEEIIAANNLTKPIKVLTERIHFIGERDSGTKLVRVCLGLFSSDDEAKSELFNLRSFVGSKSHALILCPSFEVGVELHPELDARNITCVTFKKAFPEGNFSIDFGIIKDAKPIESGAPDLTPKEEAAKIKYGYKGWDVLTFLNEKGKYGSYYVEINGRRETISAAQLLLLICFAQKLKKDKWGWVSRKEAADLKIIVVDQDEDNPHEGNNHYDDLVHKLRNRIGAHLKTCGRDEFIEANDKKFRISTMPGRVIVPHDRWLGETFAEIKESLLKKRRKKGEQWQD